MNWTEKQQKVIDSRNKNLLISAAAGSGKTAVLVERIKNIIIQDKVDVRELLVVTFTKAAASEMKEKIAKAISKAAMEYPEEAEYLLKQMDRINGANISTFDSFAQSIVRNYYYVINIESGLGICDEGESAVFQKEAMDKTFEEFFESEDTEFLEFLNAYSKAKGDDAIKESLIALYKKIRTLPFGLEDLRDMIDGLHMSEESFFEGKQGKALYENLIRDIKLAERYFKSVYELITSEGHEDLRELACVAKQDLDNLTALEDLSFEEIGEALKEFKYQTFSPKLKGPSFKDIEDEVKKIRDKLGKGHVKNINKKYFSESIKDMVESVNATKDKAEILFKIIERFHEEYGNMKTEKGLMDFSDGTYFAINILENEEVAGEIKNKFKYIFIDEYQDSNYLQERLISLIKRENNLFMVGDIKQSIYKFRMAEPEIFQEKYDLYSEERDENSEKIDLNDNFRSKREVINFVNALFEDLMEGYSDDVALHEGNVYEGPLNYKTELHIVDGKVDEDAGISDELKSMKEKELEALAAAEVIEESLGKMIFDVKTGEKRPLQKSDITVLLRSRSSGMPEYYNALMDKGIDAYILGSEGYFDTIEIMTFMDLIHVISNPKQDIKLLSTLRSEIFGFDIDELIKIRIENKKGSFYDAFVGYEKDDEIRHKIDKTLVSLKDWSEKSRYMRVDEFVWMLMRESGYYALSGTLPGGRQRQANLRVLVERAKAIGEKHDGTLNDFLTYEESVYLKKVKVPQASIAGEGDDTVKIMTIHNSKGLEYPMVLVGGLGHKFNIKSGGDWHIDKDMGIGLKDVNLQQRYSKKTILQGLIEEKHKREGLEEEIRILYVACTRAKDRLVLFAGSKDWYSKEKDMARGNVSPEDYLKLVYPVLCKKKQAVDIIVHERRDMEHLLTGAKEAVSREEKLIEIEKYREERDASLKKFVDERLSYKYPHEDEYALKSKYSVSELNSKNYDNYDVKGSFKSPDFAKAKKELSGTDIGTVMHVVMQHIDFNEALKSLNEGSEYIESFVEDMKTKEIISREEFEMVNCDKIKGFFASDIGKRAAVSERLSKEKAFTMLHEIDGKEVMVQGVIDCFFEEAGEVVLIDYKTNRNTDGIEDLYRAQTELYKKAIEESTGKRVKEVYLYLFSRNREIKM